MHRFTAALLAASISLLTPTYAAEVQSPLAFTGIAELEACAPTENQYPKVDPKFRQKVVRLVESNTLATGDDFFRAANINLVAKRYPLPGFHLHLEKFGPVFPGDE
jgi:hypothetical protein